MFVSIRTDDAHAEIEELSSTTIRLRYAPNNQPVAEQIVLKSSIPNITDMVFHYANLMQDLAKGYSHTPRS